MSLPRVLRFARLPRSVAARTSRTHTRYLRVAAHVRLHEFTHARTLICVRVRLPRTPRHEFAFVTALPACRA